MAKAIKLPKFDQKKILNYLQHEVWKNNENHEPKWKSYMVRVLRVIIISSDGLLKGQFQLRASALTYFFVLSIVPLLAMIFGIAQGFGIEKLLEEELTKAFQGQEVVLQQALTFASNMLATTQGGAIAGVGLVFLFWTVMQLMTNIELAFNEIWDVKKARGYARKFTDYFSIMFFSPIVLIVATSSTVFLSTRFQDFVSAIKILNLFSPYLLKLINYGPYVLIWLLFSLLFMIMPNTSVKFKAAFLGGVISGTVFQLTQWGYIAFQVGVSRYNAIYGSFAALPLFLIFVQLSWTIILWGARLSFAAQNAGKFEYKHLSENVNIRTRKVLSIYALQVVYTRFRNGLPPLTQLEITTALGVPAKLCRLILNELIDANMLYEIPVPGRENENGFLPTKDISEIRISDVLNAYENKGYEIDELAESKEAGFLKELLQQYDKLIENSNGNALIKDLKLG